MPKCRDMLAHTRIKSEFDKALLLSLAHFRVHCGRIDCALSIHNAIDVPSRKRPICQEGEEVERAKA